MYPTRSAQALWRCGLGAARVSWSAGEGAGGAAAARTASDDPSIPPFFWAGHFEISSPSRQRQRGLRGCRDARFYLDAPDALTSVKCRA